MKHPVANIRIADFDYPLPEEKIAKYPVEPRDSSKLLVFRKGAVSGDIYENLPSYLPDESLLVFNQTRVVQARLQFRKNENTTIEVFCLGPFGGQDIQQAMQSGSPVLYRCLIGGARKWKSGPLHLSTPSGVVLKAEKLESEEDTFIVRFSWESENHFAQILEEAGKTPLPPYLNRDAEESDKSRYQTLFALNNGSVAAPTAGLHFTASLLENLSEKGVETEFLTLHVGAGTFKPVSSDTVADHLMHAEEFFVTPALVRKIRDSISKKLIPVGTTSMRALESIYWLGVKAVLKPDDFSFEVQQWEPYEYASPPAPIQALDALLKIMKKENLELVTARTSLLIAPGYHHYLCKGLLTNFHQPKSTLLLLVASMIGEDWKTVYQYALKNDFRFLSYGDGCLLLRD